MMEDEATIRHISGNSVSLAPAMPDECAGGSRGKRTQMCSVRKNMWVLGILLMSAAASAAGPWHHPLCQDGGGVWHRRIPITFTNPTDQALKGDPASLSVGTIAQALAGVAAETVRVCDASGQEMLFALTDAQGSLRTRGPVPRDASLTIPVECGPGKSTTYYVYFDNPSAGELADFLAARTGLVNGDLEQGRGSAPRGWKHDDADATHRSEWTNDRPQSGKRCLKSVVAAGAEPTWIATRQEGIRIKGGARYVLTAWVRGQDVERPGRLVHPSGQPRESDACQPHAQRRAGHLRLEAGVRPVHRTGDRQTGPTSEPSCGEPEPHGLIM